MAKATEERRKALRQKLVALAAARVAKDGAGALRARDLAAEAGCSIGAIYNVFGEMQDLVVAVNAETFRDLGAAVTEAVETSGAIDPVERMVAMAGGYLDFAAAHPLRWRALFDVPLTEESDVPDWYLAELDGLLAIIDGPLGELFPDLPEAEVRLRTRALFSSVHGIVLLGIERRISGVGRARLLDMIRFVIAAVGDAAEKV